MEVLALPIWDALRPSLPEFDQRAKADCKHPEFMKGFRKRFGHYRRSRTNKAPRKRTFIMNMTKYPSALMSSMSKGHSGVGAGGQYGGHSISRRHQSGTGSGGAGQDRQPGLARTHRLFRLPNIPLGNVSILLGALAMQPYLEAASTAANLATMAATIWMLQNCEQQVLKAQHRQWQEQLANRTSEIAKPQTFTRAKRSMRAASVASTVGTKRSSSAVDEASAHPAAPRMSFRSAAAVVLATRPGKKARTSSSVQSPFATALSALNPAAGSAPASPTMHASVSLLNSQPMQPMYKNAIAPVSSLASQDSHTSASSPVQAAGPIPSLPSRSPSPPPSPTTASDASSELRMEQRIGGGAHGSVFLATWGGAPVAVKVAASIDQQVLNSFSREAAMLSSLQHHNIIKLLHSSPNTSSPTASSPICNIPSDSRSGDVTMADADAANAPHTHSGSTPSSPASPSSPTASVASSAAFLVEEYAELGDISSIMHAADPSQLHPFLTTIFTERLRSRTSPASPAQPTASTGDVEAMEEDVNNTDLTAPHSPSAADAVAKAQYSDPAVLKRLVLLYLLRDVASALHHLHNLPRPIIHRDLKPENILITSNGTAKLADFGVAVMHDAGAAPAAATDLFGTPQYSAPEDLWATEYQLSTSADMFSFGYLLWEVLSGERPWKGVDGCSVVFCVGLNGERLPMDRAWPEALRKLISTCWEANPQLRPSAAEVATVLDAEIEAMMAGIALKP